MPATVDEKNLLRAEFNGTPESLSDGYLDALYNAAESEYVSDSRLVQTASVKVQIAKSIRNRAMTMVTTKVGERQENLSDIAKATQAVVVEYQGRLDHQIAIDGSGGNSRIAVMKKVPSREREYPD